MIDLAKVQQHAPSLVKPDQAGWCVHRRSPVG